MLNSESRPERRPWLPKRAVDNDSARIRTVQIQRLFCNARLLAMRSVPAAARVVPLNVFAALSVSVPLPA